MESGLSGGISSSLMCQMNQVFGRPDRIVYSLVMGVHNRVLDQQGFRINHAVLKKSGLTVCIIFYHGV